MVDSGEAARVERLLELYEETQGRLRRTSAELRRLEGAAVGLQNAASALGARTTGGVSEIGGDRLRGEVHDLLREVDPYQQGLHYQEVSRLLEARGYIVRGQTCANVLAHMSSSPRFRSVTRGFWTWA